MRGVQCFKINYVHLEKSSLDGKMNEMVALFFFFLKNEKVGQVASFWYMILILYKIYDI